MWVSSAFAQGTASGPPGGEYFQIILIGGMFVVLYFLMIRPQQKKMKEHQSLIKNLQKGDEVIAGGGILAKIAKVDDVYVSLEIAPNVEIKVQKGSVLSVLPKGTIRKAD